MKEAWRQIPDYPYKISNLGRVLNIITGTPLKILSNYNGYSVINLYNENGMKQFRVSRLVAMAFIPNPENKSQVNHKNGIKTDNRASELEWSTSKENITHSWETGLNKNFGAGNGRAMLSEKQAVEILTNHGNYSRHSDIAREYKVSTSTINYLIARKSWKHLTI